MTELLKTLQDEIDQLQKIPLLECLNKIEIDQKLKLSEPNRRGLNLLLDLHNRQITTLLLLKACLFREESRGGHYRDDFPIKETTWKCHTRQQLNHEIIKRFIKN
jgi:L-aspartate oxidase